MKAYRYARLDYAPSLFAFKWSRKNRRIATIKSNLLEVAKAGSFLMNVSRASTLLRQNSRLRCNWLLVHQALPLSILLQRKSLLDSIRAINSVPGTDNPKYAWARQLRANAPKSTTASVNWSSSQLGLDWFETVENLKPAYFPLGPGFAEKAQVNLGLSSITISYLRRTLFTALDGIEGFCVPAFHFSR